MIKNNKKTLFIFVLYFLNHLKVYVLCDYAYYHCIAYNFEATNNFVIFYLYKLIYFDFRKYK